MLILSRDQVREVDRRAIEEWGISGLVLMENAGRGCCEIVLAHLAARKHQLSPPQVAICCGAGNNGGDGFVIARHLQIAGVESRVLLFASPEKLRGDAETNYKIARQAGVPIEVFPAAEFSKTQSLAEQTLLNEIRGSTVIVDALLGTGATGNPRPPFDAAIAAINSAKEGGSWVLAVDLPSGLDCQTGEIGSPTVRADVTATFVSAKPGLLAWPAAEHVGELNIVSIGVPPSLIREVACGH